MKEIGFGGGGYVGWSGVARGKPCACGKALGFGCTGRAWVLGCLGGFQISGEKLGNFTRSFTVYTIQIILGRSTIHIRNCTGPETLPTTVSKVDRAYTI
jgi:hypothetical protein